MKKEERVTYPNYLIEKLAEKYAATVPDSKSEAYLGFVEGANKILEELNKLKPKYY